MTSIAPPSRSRVVRIWSSASSIRARLPPLAFGSSSASASSAFARSSSRSRASDGHPEIVAEVKQLVAVEVVRVDGIGDQDCDERVERYQSDVDLLRLGIGHLLDAVVHLSGRVRALGGARRARQGAHLHRLDAAEPGALDEELDGAPGADRTRPVRLSASPDALAPGGPRVTITEEFTRRDFGSSTRRDGRPLEMPATDQALDIAIEENVDDDPEVVPAGHLNARDVERALLLPRQVEALRDLLGDTAAIPLGDAARVGRAGQGKQCQCREREEQRHRDTHAHVRGQASHVATVTRTGTSATRERPAFTPAARQPREPPRGCRERGPESPCRRETRRPRRRAPRPRRRCRGHVRARGRRPDAVAEIDVSSMSIASSPHASHHFLIDRSTPAGPRGLRAGITLILDPLGVLVEQPNERLEVTFVEPLRRPPDDLHALPATWPPISRGGRSGQDACMPNGGARRPLPHSTGARRAGTGDRLPRRAHGRGACAGRGRRPRAGAAVHLRSDSRDRGVRGLRRAGTRPGSSCVRRAAQASRDVSRKKSP